MTIEYNVKNNFPKFYILAIIICLHLDCTFIGLCDQKKQYVKCCLTLSELANGGVTADIVILNATHMNRPRLKQCFCQPAVLSG